MDAETGSVIAGTLGGWSCDAANPPTQFDGSFALERLPVGHSYDLYAEPLVGLALPGDFSDVFTGLCSSSVAPTCTPPPVNTNFNVRVMPATQRRNALGCKKSGSREVREPLPALRVR